MKKLQLLEVIEEIILDANNKTITNEWVRLTKKGLDYANVVWEEFV